MAAVPAVGQAIGQWSTSARRSRHGRMGRGGTAVPAGHLACPVAGVEGAGRLDVR